jgi:hypothetical protein
MSASTAKKPKSKAKAKPARARKFDLSWLLDRPLPADIDTRENYVLVLRERYRS